MVKAGKGITEMLLGAKTLIHNDSGAGAAGEPPG
jgi:hypothetical protein